MQINAIARYLSTLRFEGYGSAAAELGLSALQICKLAAWISAETDDPEGVIMAVSAALVTVHTEDSEAFRWAEQTTKDLSSVDVRADALQIIDRTRRRWRGEKVDGDYQGDTVWQIMQNIATGIGLDLSDENSALVRELRIAARDNSPERVLVHCEHLLVTPGAFGPTARQIRELVVLTRVGRK